MSPEQPLPGAHTQLPGASSASPALRCRVPTYLPTASFGTHFDEHKKEAVLNLILHSALIIGYSKS